jgi:hypothetical protein
MNCIEIEARARAMAEKAKPGMLRIDGKLYTFAFDQNEWVYRVYEDGFLLVSFNCKALAAAKRMLREWLAA